MILRLRPTPRRWLRNHAGEVIIAVLALMFLAVGGPLALGAAAATVVVLSFLGAIFFALVQNWQRSGDRYKARLRAAREGVPEPAFPPLQPFAHRVRKLFVRGLRELPLYVNPFSVVAR
ncbi:hypothetical protein [Sphingomonas mesophila]|uniref:hypothetical protein n=1 Tax=Sphingomonas mesophila TaxID=2303576 RepID=UPI000E570803|nr:hypothetical protein [Sphingomonas mesophila]